MTRHFRENYSTTNSSLTHLHTLGFWYLSQTYRRLLARRLDQTAVRSPLKPSEYKNSTLPVGKGKPAHWAPRPPNSRPTVLRFGASRFCLWSDPLAAAKAVLAYEKLAAKNLQQAAAHGLQEKSEDMAWPGLLTKLDLLALRSQTHL